MKQYIFVVESGWVFMGKCALDSEGDNHDLQECSVIRVWGTTKGLGEIALGGPTPKTILDPCGTAIIPKSKVLAILPCTY